MAELIVPAAAEQLAQVLNFIEEQLTAAACPMKQQMQMAIAAEEIFINIASYAYSPGTGDARIQCEITKEPACVLLQFEDSGAAYDPLAKEDPDVTLGAKERTVGGLGIYLVKKSMDDVSYEYRDGKNILTLKKFL